MLEPHSLCRLIPEMTESQFGELADDIKTNGLIEPITLLDGQILDGRNRYRACVKLGIAPIFETFTGSDPEAFVISKNLKRRHLTPDQQRALADVRRKKVAEMRGQGMSTRTISEKLDISHTQVKRDIEDAGGTHVPPDPPIAESESAPTPDPPKVTGRDGKKYPATKPPKTSAPRGRKPKPPDAALLKTIRNKLIGDIQRIKNECDKWNWDEASEFLKQAQNSLKR